jgi:plastocyanin
VAGLGLAGTLLISLAGCGKEGDVDNSIVVTEPGANVSTAGTSSTAAAPATGKTGGAPAAASPGTAAPAENVKAEGWGSLKGQVTFTGDPPAVKVLMEKGKASKDPEVCAKDGPINSERLVVDAASKGVKNVLVYIPKPTAVNPEVKSEKSSAQVDFDQQKCVFTPHVIAVMTGAKILMKNSDSINHNIDSKLKNNATNPNIPGGNSMPFATQVGERAPGEVVCDIHPWMKAYWLVIDSPYAAVTDEKGNFEIKNVPAGTQKVVVWQESVEKGGYVTPASGESVTIKADGHTQFDVKIDAAKIRPE